jgi:dihydrofolate reductase
MDSSTTADGSVERLYPDLEALRRTEFLKEAIANTGAVVMGRRAYEMANGDFTGYEFQVPIFVITHRAPKDVANGQNERLSFALPGDVTSAVEKAKKAAGNKFGEGLRLFENLGSSVQVETIKVLTSPNRTDIKFRVAR